MVNNLISNIIIFFERNVPFLNVVDSIGRYVFQGSEMEKSSVLIPFLKPIHYRYFSLEHFFFSNSVMKLC